MHSPASTSLTSEIPPPCDADSDTLATPPAITMTSSTPTTPNATHNPVRFFFGGGNGGPGGYIPPGIGPP